MSQYEEQGEASKVIRHMENFDLLLDHQLDQDLIPENTYAFLKADGETSINYGNKGFDINKVYSSVIQEYTLI